MDCFDEWKKYSHWYIEQQDFFYLSKLRKLRTLFISKFENTLEPYVSKEIIDEITLIVKLIFKKWDNMKDDTLSNINFFYVLTCV